MAIILLLYSIGILIFLIFGSVCIFHAFKYKMPSDNALKGAYMFMGVTAAILIISFLYMTDLNWNAKPNFFKGGLKVNINKTK